MHKRDLVTSEIEETPEPLLDEVLDFIRSLKSKQSSDLRAVTLASEASLRKHWMRPEEEEAWRNL